MPFFVGESIYHFNDLLAMKIVKLKNDFMLHQAMKLLKMRSILKLYTFFEGFQSCEIGKKFTHEALWLKQV